jgi:hypothetical protein
MQSATHLALRIVLGCHTDHRRDNLLKQLRSALGSVGLASILIVGTSGSSAHANNQKSPLRGTWSWSQLVLATSAFGTPAPIPTAAAGTLVMNADNSFTGHAVLNTPLGEAFELDFEGACTVRNGNISNGLDCRIDVPAFGVSEDRFCVVMANDRGQCFDEYRCVNTDASGTVVVVEFKRQRSGTCK